MMFTENLTNLFPWNRESEINGKFIVVQDSMSMCGDFAMTTMIIKAIKENHSLHILSLNHGRSHYESIFRKNVSSKN